MKSKMTCQKLYLLLQFCIIVNVLKLSIASKVQMRIVHETANYGYFGNNAEDADGQSKLVAHAKPSNFSGPVLLKKLLGKCFSVTLERYRYVFCPFQNMTQHETTLRWNSYQGVLGVWSHWKIENNSFAKMVFTHGDDCGDIKRKVQVHLRCGAKESLQNVTEPTKCQYEAIFQTRYICHDDSLLVYPRLNDSQRKEWDLLWTNYKHGYLTEKGYQKGLEKMFYEAGLVTPIKVIGKTEETSAMPNNDQVAATFTDLGVCNIEYDKLKKEIIQLNEEITSLKLLFNPKNDPQKVRRHPHKH